MHLYKRLFLILVLLSFGRYMFSQRALTNEELVKAFLLKAESEYLLDTAEHYAKKALVLASRAGLRELQLKSLFTLARNSIERSEYDSAIHRLDQGLGMLQKNESDLLASGLLEKGRALQLKKEHTSALQIFLQASQILENSDNKELLTREAVYLAEYYRNLGRYADAETQIRAALASAFAITADKELLINVYNRAAAIKSEMSQGDSSLYYSRIALKISRELKKTHLEAVSLNEIAFILESQFKLEEASNTYKKAEDIWKVAGYKRYWINAAENRARVYQKAGLYQRSNELLASLVETALENKWSANLNSIYLTMSVNYEKLGDEAMKYRCRAMGLEAAFDVYRRENEKALEEVKLKYEAEKKEILLRKQKKETEIAYLKYDAQRRETKKLFYGALGLMALLILIVYIAWQRSRLNGQLRQKNLEINMVNRKLEASLNRTEILMKEVHHRVKNNLQIISSMFHLQADSVQSEEMRQLLIESDNRVMLMASLHERLYSQGDLEKLEVKGFIEEVVNGVFQSFQREGSHIQFESKIEHLTVEMSKAVVIGIVINELVTNCIKHAFATDQKNKKVMVRVEAKNDKVRLSIADNGRGIPENFSIRNASSFGLNLVNIMVEQVNGSIKAENRQGTIIDIEL